MPRKRNAAANFTFPIGRTETLDRIVAWGTATLDTDADNPLSGTELKAAIEWWCRDRLRAEVFDWERGNAGRDAEAGVPDIED